MPIIELELNFDVIDASGEVIHLSTLDELVRLVKEEERFWLDAERHVSEVHTCHNLIKVGHSFTKLISHIENKVINSDLDQSKTPGTVRQIFQHYINSNGWIWSGREYADRFVEINREKGHDVAHAFYCFLVKNVVANINQKASIEGVLLAYEYSYQDSSLVSRSKTERKSIARIRSDLVDKNREVIKEISENSKDFESWQNSKHNEFEELFSKYKAKSEKLDNDVIEKLRGWDKRFDELEQKHHEQLRLAKPAKYWKEAAKAHGRRGIFASLLISLLIMASLIGLSEFFTIWLLNKEQVISLQSIQGAVIFASMAALVAFIVKVLAKLAFSSFHLMRDSEEREQLTYLYLSLSDQKVLDESARDIVLQALFSRSETGLLSQESGPSMPGGHEALKSVLRSN